MENIHVLHVLNSAHGGSALSTFELIDELKARGIKSSLICFNNASPALSKSISEKVAGRVLFIPLYWMNKKIRAVWWKRPIMEMLSVWRTGRGHKHQARITELVNREGINVIHTSTILNPEGAIAAKRNKLPHVWHVRELIGPKTYFQFPKFAAWIDFVTKHADCLVANSSVTYKNLEHFFHPTKLLTIPNGINPELFSVKEHRSDKPIVIGMVGNVTSRLKNHELFIETANMLASENYQFKIYGELPSPDDPYYLSLLERVNEHGLKDNLQFKGHYASPFEIMKEIDILFHPTPNESFGRIFIEAMAAGIPVVGINQGGALEMIQDDFNGYLVNPDAKEASLKLKKLAQSADLRNEMGRNGRLRVEEKYTVNRVGDQVMELYKQLLDTRRNTA
ncbi:MAG: glycosyltransferase family 4 protein [Cyclobacteriaceae bacterium]|nr:glycosyltransferase family 4 protein [Cyclobacteriaceae bacterium]